MAHLVDGTDEIAQGAILVGVDWGLDPNPLSIVLSNECDLINGKASFIIVAALVEAKETITGSEEYKNKTQGITDNEVGKSKWETIKKFLDGYIYNKGITRYFFINPADAIYWWIFSIFNQSQLRTLEILRWLPNYLPHSKNK